VARLALAALTEPISTAAPRYTITDLGLFPGRSDARASDLNNRGLVVGDASEPGDDQPVPLLWKDGKPAALPGLPGRDAARALGINDAGDIVGEIDRRERDEYDEDACLWSHGKPRLIGRLPGRYCVAMRINARGQIIGWNETEEPTGNALGSIHALFWDKGKLIRLATPAGQDSGASAINAAGWIAGGITRAAPTGGGGFKGISQAVIWKQGKRISLGGLGGEDSYANGINNRGEVAGYASTARGDKHAFLWREGRMADLGTLGGTSSEAEAINNRGQVVGKSERKASLRSLIGRAQHATLWESGKALDLNDLIPKGTGWTLLEANAINDRGQILGHGWVKLIEHPFLLTPVTPGR
jgi:probable HAF family extracellular repeat protein